jgi:outer membrane murein-binding lipoprotein Lpp
VQPDNLQTKGFQMKITAKLLFSLSIISLTGCATLEQMPKATSSVQAERPIISQAAEEVVKESLPQICQAAKENKVRANEYYAKKRYSTSGEVRTINEGFQPKYRVYIRSGKVSIHAGTDNLNATRQLSVGKSTTVSGVITDVSYDYQGCSVSLKESTF